LHSRAHLKDTTLKEHKKHTGIRRIAYAFGYSLQGFKAGWFEPAFRQEAIAAFVMLPLSWWLGNTWLERAVLAGVVVAAMVVELLNTAIESAIDRIGPEWHPLSKRAKDLGSAAVTLTLFFCLAVWVAALWHKLLPV
jgi:diacylglycerol kinase (ATP)